MEMQISKYLIPHTGGKITAILCPVLSDVLSNFDL